MRRRLQRLALLGACACAACLPGTPVPDNQPPVAVAGEDVSAIAGEPLQLDGRGSYDPDGEIVGYSWNTGDGTTIDLALAEHTYQAAGRFVVALTVTDDQGATGSDERIVEVTGGGPTAAISISPTVAHRFQEVLFDGMSSQSRLPITAYQWSFGDGATASGVTAWHAYANEGIFRVQLTVVDEGGAQGSAEELLTVLPYDVDGTYDLTPSPALFSCSAYDVSFTEGAFTFIADGAGGLGATSDAGHGYSGTLDDLAFSVSASYTASTGPGCGSAPCSATFSGSFSADGSLSGTWVGYYDLSVPCQCTAAFDVAGVRR